MFRNESTTDESTKLRVRESLQSNESCVQREPKPLNESSGKREPNRRNETNMSEENQSKRVIHTVGHRGKT
jgi:hypothetical protein